MMTTGLHVPGKGDRWEHRAPGELGLDADRLADAAAFSVDHETPWPTDLRAAIAQTIASEEGELGTILGPVKDRGGVSGIIVRHGYIAAEWGDTARVDMTFSISKSYLASLAGLALDRGLIRDIDDPVRTYADDGGFDPPHNSQITWRHLLTLTSEWTGTLWEKPDQIDHHRGVAGAMSPVGKGARRELQAPGTYWEYNDVRVNRLSLALLRVWRRALPDVFRESIMEPIGASDTWRWHGYESSYVEIDGQRIQSVSGGGHWGGGVWVHTRDHGRFGLLHLRRGRWGDRQIVSERWVETATTPSAVNAGYGCLWWLNTGQERFPAAPASSYFALGWGSNLIWVDPEHDILAVVRWIDSASMNGFMARVMAAVRA